MLKPSQFSYYSFGSWKRVVKDKHNFDMMIYTGCRHIKKVQERKYVSVSQALLWHLPHSWKATPYVFSSVLNNFIVFLENEVNNENVAIVCDEQICPLFVSFLGVLKLQEHIHKEFTEEELYLFENSIDEDYIRMIDVHRFNIKKRNEEKVESVTYFMPFLEMRAEDYSKLLTNEFMIKACINYIRDKILKEVCDYG